MIEAVYKKKGIRIAQIWFAEEEDKPQEKADVLFFHGISDKKDDKYCLSTTFHTLITDLKLSNEELLSQINKNVRYEIRRNTKEPVEYRTYTSKQLLDNPDVVRSFTDMYRIMYKEKGINQEISSTQLEAYLNQNAFFLTGIFSEDTPLVFHSYIVGKNQVRLLHSVSDFRSENADANLIARANKRLHWEDICMFQEQGVQIYDWGGVSSLDNPNGIDAFKFKFGGNPLTYFNVYKGKSLIGKAVVTLLKIKNRENK